MDVIINIHKDVSKLDNVQRIWMNVMNYIKIVLYQMDVLLMHQLNVRVITNVLEPTKLVKALKFVKIKLYHISVKLIDNVLKVLFNVKNKLLDVNQMKFLVQMVHVTLIILNVN
jgi:hypothetical protein